MKNWADLTVKRGRTYWHLGFLHALLEPDADGLQRPELNQNRKSWYVAGRIAGVARLQDPGSFTDLLAAHSDLIDWSIQNASPHTHPHSLLATGFDLFIIAIRSGDTNAGRILRRLLRRSVYTLGPRSVDHYIQKASEFFFAGDETTADGLLADIVGGLKPVANNTIWQRVVWNANRRYAQCAQASGRLQQAQRLYEELAADAPDDLERAKVALDQTLASAGLRSFKNIRLDDQTALSALVDLRSKILEIHEAAGRSLVIPPLLVGLMDYKSGAQESALAFLDEAVMQVQSATFGDYFTSTQTYQHAKLARAVLLADSSDPNLVRRASQQAEGLIQSDHRFPLVDRLRLTYSIEVVDEPRAQQLLEKWFAPDEYAACLGGGVSAALLCRAEGAFEQVMKSALLGKLEQDRIDTLMRLATATLKENQIEEATRCLDALESVCHAENDFERFEIFLKKQENYSPAWTFDEAQWASVRIARLQGRDARAAELLRNLFYRARNEQAGVANDIIEQLEEWNHDSADLESLRAALPADEVATASESVEGRLASGEIVRIVFIGGNEIQAQYDDSIEAAIKEKWPGVRIKFFHTGWSSNWGREVDSIIDKANRSDIAILHQYMRTMLGRTLREKIETDWRGCAVTGRSGIQRKIEEAAVVVAARKE